MKDRAGNNLSVGDKVLYLQAGTSTSRLVWGTIDSFTPKMVVFAVQESWGTEKIRRLPSSVVKPFREPCVYDCSICHEGEDEE